MLTERMTGIMTDKTRLRSESPHLHQDVKSQPKVIRDSNPDFRINPDSNPDVCRIAPKMLRIHRLVGVSYFAECRENRPVTV